MAQGLGCYGEYVEQPEDIRPALERAQKKVDDGMVALVNGQDRLPRPRHDRPLLELHDLIFLTADKGRLQALLRFRVVKRDRRLILPLLLAVPECCCPLFLADNSRPS